MTGKENRALARRRWLAWSSVLVLVLLALFVGAPLFLGPGDDEAGGGDSGDGATSAPAASSAAARVKRRGPRGRQSRPA